MHVHTFSYCIYAMYIIHACCCALTKQGGDFQLQAMQLLLHLRKQAEDTHDQLIKFPLLILLKNAQCTIANRGGKFSNWI